MITVPHYPLDRPHLDWMTDAACRDQDPDLFFPVSPHGANGYQIHEAKSICEDCVVQGMCLRYALATEQSAGIWGGHTEEERSRLKRRRPREPIR